MLLKVLLKARRKEVILRKKQLEHNRRGLDSLRYILALALAVAVTTAKPASGASFKAQENKSAQGGDKRADALKKYLEAQRMDQAGNYPGAVAAYKEALALDPQSVELRTALGALYLKNRNVIDAEAQAQEAVKLAPDNVDVRKLLARIYLAQTFVGTNIVKEKARAALKVLEEIARIDKNAKIEIGDGEQPVLAVVGSLYWTLDEQDKALEALKNVSEGNSTADHAHFQLASLYYQKNKFREAATAARKAYDIDPKSPQYAGLLAKSLLRIGRTQEALDIYKKAIGVKDTPGKENKPKPAEDKTGKDDKDDDSGTWVTSPLLFDYAEALVYSGRYDDANKLLDPLMKAVRKDTAVYLNVVKYKATVLRRTGKREEAVQLLEGALKGLAVDGLTSVRQGKVFDIELDGDDHAAARRRLSEACERLLANTIVENYAIEIT